MQLARSAAISAIWLLVLARGATSQIPAAREGPGFDQTTYSMGLGVGLRQIKLTSVPDVAATHVNLRGQRWIDLGFGFYGDVGTDFFFFIRTSIRTIPPRR